MYSEGTHIIIRQENIKNGVEMRVKEPRVHIKEIR